MIKYRVITEKGYAEFSDQEAANDFALEKGYEVGPIEVSTFDLSQHKTDMEQAVDALVNQTMQELWYASKGDIAINALDPNSIWQEEAQALSAWINATYATLQNYLATVTEETYVSIEDFVNSTQPNNTLKR